MDKDKSYQWIMIVFRTCQQSLKGDIVGSSSDPLASDSSISQDKSDGRRNTNPLNLAQSDIRFGTRNDRVQDRIDYHWVNILQVLVSSFFNIRSSDYFNVLTVQGFLPATLTLLIKVGLYFYFNLYFLLMTMKKLK